ncbi:hypothetical protein HS5_14140 [Acidianus sp. HS-5]|nr:hypothetical protein HS5_14140 [Acidianus sp. HS-5]
MGHEVSFVSTYISEEVKEELDWADFELIKQKVGLGYSLFHSLPILRDWMKSMIFPYKVEVKGDVVINSSSSILANSTVYYGQGQITKALDDIVNAKDFPLKYKVIYKTFDPAFRRMEKKHVHRVRENSKFFITNSNYSKTLYESWGIKVDNVIYPPLDDSLFRPTKNPEGDYVLTYVGVEGKETDFEVLKLLSKAGVKIKAFGRVKRKMENVEFLGFVEEKELVDLYANALFTLVLFNHEPFGYVPVESMACGTPVLTYSKQGPAETVCEDCGWLVNGRNEIVKKAIEIWENGYNPEMRKNAVIRAKRYSKDVIIKKWLDLIMEEEKKDKSIVR